MSTYTPERRVPNFDRTTCNIMLYGPTGAGKSMGAASAPGPIMYLNGDGDDALDLAHATFGDKLHEYPVTKDNAKQTLDWAYIEAQKGEYETVVLDPIGEIYQALLDQASNSGHISLSMRGDASTKLQRFSRLLRDLPVNFIICAQESVEDQGDEVSRRPQVGPTQGTLSEKLMQMMGIIGYVGVVQDESEGGSGQRRHMAQLVEARGRKAKGRLGVLGDSRETNLTEWIELMSKALKEIKGKDEKK